MSQLQDFEAKQQDESQALATKIEGIEVAMPEAMQKEKLKEKIIREGEERLNVLVEDLMKLGCSQQINDLLLSVPNQ